jgi:hypothetical protein
MPLGWLAVRELLPLAEPRIFRARERFDEYRERLLTADPDREAAYFALRPECAARAPVDARFDRLATRALAVDPQRDAVWLDAFPEPRRSRIVAASGNAWLHGNLAPHCDPATVATSVVDAFFDPSCDWDAFEAQRVLIELNDAALLRAALPRATGIRRRVLERVIQELTREGYFTLALAPTDGGIEARLARPAGAIVEERLLSPAPLREELAFVADALAGEERAVLEITSELDRTLAYQIFLHLGELLRIEIILGGTRRIPSRP